MLAIKIIGIAVFLGCIAGALINWVRYVPGKLKGHTQQTIRARNVFLIFWAVGMIDVLVMGWLVSALS